MPTPEHTFDRWFVCPLRQLRSIPDGDGGFIAIATSCFLYERYARAVLKRAGRPAKTPALIQQLAHDFETDEETSKAFWTVIRDGVLHQGMPMARRRDGEELPTWAFRGDFNRSIELVHLKEKRILKVQPWLFMERVISLWHENTQLLAESASFPWAGIALLSI